MFFGMGLEMIAVLIVAIYLLFFPPTAA